MTHITRRLFLKYVAAAGTASAAFVAVGPEGVRRVSAAERTSTSRAARRSAISRRYARRNATVSNFVPGGSLDPTSITKYVTPLLIPPVMPPAGRVKQKGGKAFDYYEISVEQLEEQILPEGFPATKVWGYGAYGGFHHAPSLTIEAQWNKPVRVRWINNLIDPYTKEYLPHLLTVDQTLHWANPHGPRDSHGIDPEPYTGPVPMVAHVHGAHTGDESDGYAEAWYLPPAKNIPGGYATEGTWYNTFKQKFLTKFGEEWVPGSATFHYPNDQDAATLWYHDHSLGMTRLNVYAGPAGFYILRGGSRDQVGGTLPGPAPTLGDAPGTRYYEIPIAIQDRSFNADGSLFFPDNRAFFEGLSQEQLQIPFIPEEACGGESDISPIWNPEFFGNTMMVNGNTWPYLEVEPRRYRFRFLNGCNARFLILRLSNGRPFYQIGAEGGFLPAPVQLNELLISPAERADVIVDFSGLPEGTQILLQNDGPDEPYGGGEPDADFEPADLATTGQVMQFRVVPLVGADKSTPPMNLHLPAPRSLPAPTNTRQVSLNEMSSGTVFAETDEDGNVVLACGELEAEAFGPQMALLGTVMPPANPGEMPIGMPLPWMDPITENPAVHSTEVWEIYNYTMDAHPIHVHQVMFEVVNREVFDPMEGQVPAGTVFPPDPDESGRKDTVIAYPGQITRIKATFDLEGLYVWHCHIIDHEDNEMMRPYAVGTPTALIP